MRSCLTGLCMLSVWVGAVLPASAGWDNVFQPTLFGRLRQPSTSSNYYAPPLIVQSSPIVACAPTYVAQSAPCPTSCAPTPPCSTSYVQRSYYQPVTTYQNSTVMEKVTSYRTSYYYEPVTSYRYTSYYDPSTGCAQQVAVPTTSYSLRAQNCPVESWVARCVQVPVQSYQKVDYLQPQTTCCQTTLGTPIVGAAPASPQTPPPSIPPYDDKPSVQGSKTQGMAAPKTNRTDLYYPQIDRTVDFRGTPNTSWQPQLGAPEPVPSTLPQPAPPPVKFERIAANSTVEGVVVRNDSSPKADAKLLFINAGTGERQTIVTNNAGRFQTELATGSWHVYVHGADGVPVHNSRIDVNGAQTRQVSLVSRSN